MFFRNSKPLVGFDDRLLVISGILINTHAVVTSFYQGAIYNVTFLQYLPKWLEYFFFVSFMWLVIRGLLLSDRKKHPGFEHRRKRWLYVPIMILPYLISAVLYLKYIQPLLNIQMPGYPPPQLKQLLITGSFVVVIDTAIYIILMYYYALSKAQIKQERLKKEKAISDLKALKNQLSPHFLSNSLTTLLFLMDSDKEKSKDFAFKLVSVYNKLLDFSEQDLIPIRDELQYISEYIDLLNARFGNNLNVSIKVDNSITYKMIVPLSIQIGVENAVKHNVVSAKHPLEISIWNETQHIVVKNTFQPKEKNDKRGIGIANLKKRYQLLTKKKLTVGQSQDAFYLRIPIIE